MKVYAVNVRCIFDGEFLINAETKEQAAEYAMKHCSVVASVHSSLPDEDVDWNFPVHPEKKVQSVRVA